MSDYTEGDRVRHKQIPEMIGEFVRYGKPTNLSRTWPGRGIQRPVYWRVTRVGDLDIDPDLQSLDYTWENVMERYP